MADEDAGRPTQGSARDPIDKAFVLLCEIMADLAVADAAVTVTVDGCVRFTVSRAHGEAVTDRPAALNTKVCPSCGEMLQIVDAAHAQRRDG